MTKTLECHSRGDLRFSPFGARVTVDLVNRTIEDHYQAAKVFEGSVQARDWRHARELKKSGARQIGWKICGMFFHTKEDPAAPRLTFDLTDMGIQFYILLWLKYMQDEPHLIAYAAQFDEFRDPFAGSFPFCQARVWETAARGRTGIAELEAMCAPLREIIRLHKQGR